MGIVAILVFFRGIAPREIKVLPPGVLFFPIEAIKDSTQVSELRQFTVPAI
jgi:hypothetical protein